jgi:archaellum component FlaD/FlaE
LAEEPADTENQTDEEEVTFADLKGIVDEAAAEGETHQEVRDEDAHSPQDTEVEVQPTDSVDAEADDSAETDDATLAELPETYAADVVIFEWLTALVRTGGTAATLRAISYYDEIGWIDEEVRAHLEDVLSGPDLDVHVDPETPPEELTAEDHAESYTYIMKLSEIHETKADVIP